MTLSIPLKPLLDTAKEKHMNRSAQQETMTDETENTENAENQERPKGLSNKDIHIIRERASELSVGELLPYRLSKTKGSKFPSDTKARAIRLAVREGHSLDAIGAALGVSGSGVSTWVRQWREERSQNSVAARATRAAAALERKVTTTATPPYAKEDEKAKPELKVVRQAEDRAGLREELARVTAERDLYKGMLFGSRQQFTAEEVMKMLEASKGA